MNIKIYDLQSIYYIFWSTVILGFFVGLFLFRIIDTFILYVSRKIQKPDRIKSDSGYLYRDLNGVYTSKAIVIDRMIDKKRKRLKHWIAHHEYVLKRLKADI